MNAVGHSFGNARFLFGPKCSEHCSEATVTTMLAISSLLFSDGQMNAYGLEVIINFPDVYVVISNVTVKNNSGGNLALSVTDFGHPSTQPLSKSLAAVFTKGEPVREV